MNTTPDNTSGISTESRPPVRNVPPPLAPTPSATGEDAGTNRLSGGRPALS
jgi:hypothetical protein